MAETYGYIRVSTGKQAKSGLGLEAQLALLVAAGVEHHRIWVETASAKTGSDRPELDTLLSILERGDTLVVAKLDRLARSTVDFGRILQRAAKDGWHLVMLDLGVDTRTSVGKLVANIIAAVAEFERDIISERTTAALGAKKERGECCGGRKTTVPYEHRVVMANYRNCGLSYSEIAGRMNTAGYRSPSGNPWTKDAVRSALAVVNT